MRVHVCIWRQCNKDPSAELGMTVLGGVDRFTRVVWRLFRRWYSRIAAFLSRGRCPAGADRVTMV